MDFTCIFFGVLFTVAGFVFACGKGHIHLSAAFGDHWFVGAMIAWLVVAGFDVWYIGKSKRYQN